MYGWFKKGYIDCVKGLLAGLEDEVVREVRGAVEGFFEEFERIDLEKMDRRGRMGRRRQDG